MRGAKWVDMVTNDALSSRLSVRHPQTAVSPSRQGANRMLMRWYNRSRPAGKYGMSLAQPSGLQRRTAIGMAKKYAHVPKKAPAGRPALFDKMWAKSGLFGALLQVSRE